MALLKINGAGGELIIPEHNDLEWVQSVLSELKARLEALEEEIYDGGYQLHGECMTLVQGLEEYHGGQG